MRGFLTSTERKYSLTLVIVTIMCLLFIPAYMVWDLSNTLGTLALRVTDMELKHAEDRQILKTLNVRVNALADEQKFIREQEPSRSVSGRNSQLFEITAYTCGPESTGKRPGDRGYCVTASGYKLSNADAMKVVAADPRIFKAGTKLMIEGIGIVIVRDTGGAITGNRLDLFTGETAVKEALEWGRKWRKVTILQ